MSTIAGFVGGSGIPEKPSVDGLEATWAQRWAERGVYRFDRSRSRDEVYSIDTPPPTVSGSLHVGHVFSYTHADILARYKRMRGYEVFYPMGWDDNGLPTERRVENYFGVRCDPTLPYNPAFTPPGAQAKERVLCSRRNFVELCHQLTATDEQAFEHLWRMLGYSVDWDLTYTTISDLSRKTSQRVFLDQVAAGQAYQAEAPIMWDTTNETAVAQAELEDREVAGAFHRLRFDDIEIETTRPELLPACVALVAHPDDERYAGRFGQTVHTPLFDVEIPILAHRLADPDKGSGIAMICTFGDVTDVIWWRELGLALRPITTRNGRIQHAPPEGVPQNAAWDALAGRTLKQARQIIVDLLRGSGALVGEPRSITHAVKFYERGKHPIEIVTSRQWFFTLLDRREDFLREINGLQWLPSFMRNRLVSWIEGLNSDWLLSRQRFFGVAIPLWYPVREDGSTDYEHPIMPSPQQLPVDPSSDVPAGYQADQRGVPGGFVGDPDVLDTWATSSLTPQIIGHWSDDTDLFGRIFPMDLRPQSHEIIRTWLFYTVVRSLSQFDQLPWRSVLISGWVLDADRKKMSKSKGNVTTPMHLVERYSSDALRYWSANGRPGTDTAFDESQLRVGRRLAVKVLNASKFILTQVDGTVERDSSIITEPLDLAALGALENLVTEVTEAYEAYDYTRALGLTETYFWSFCDDYLKLVKERSYGMVEGVAPASVASAHATLRILLSVLLRLFAPVLVFATEEAWSWHSDGSVHRAPWPTVPLAAGVQAGDPLVTEMVSTVLGEIRKTKSTAKRSMKTPVTRLMVTDTEPRLAALRLAAPDLLRAGKVAEVDYKEADEFAVTVELEPEPSAQAASPNTAGDDESASA